MYYLVLSKNGRTQLMCTQNKLLLCNEVRAYSSIRDRQIAQEELICRGVRSEPIKCKTLRNYLGRNFEVTFASDPTNKYPLDSKLCGFAQKPDLYQFG
jgi:hypothetical protein